MIKAEKKQIFGVILKTYSEAEVVLEAFDKWGYNSINRCEGMFGFAIWNYQLKKLSLVLEHIGLKSIYYAETPFGLIFASEIKALFASGLVKRRLNQKAMSHYMKVNSRQSFSRHPSGIFFVHPELEMKTLRFNRAIFVS